MMIKRSTVQKWLEKRESNLVGLTSSTAFTPLFPHFHVHFYLSERFFIFTGNYRYIYRLTKLFQRIHQIHSSLLTMQCISAFLTKSPPPTPGLGWPSIFSPYQVFMHEYAHTRCTARRTICKKQS